MAIFGLWPKMTKERPKKGAKAPFWPFFLVFPFLWKNFFFFHNSFFVKNFLLRGKFGNFLGYHLDFFRLFGKSRKIDFSTKSRKSPYGLKIFDKNFQAKNGKMAIFGLCFRKLAKIALNFNTKGPFCGFSHKILCEKFTIFGLWCWKLAPIFHFWAQNGGPKGQKLAKIFYRAREKVGLGWKFCAIARKMGAQSSKFLENFQNFWNFGKFHLGWSGSAKIWGSASLERPPERFFSGVARFLAFLIESFLLKAFLQKRIFLSKKVFWKKGFWEEPAKRARGQNLATPEKRSQSRPPPPGICRPLILANPDQPKWNFSKIPKILEIFQKFGRLGPHFRARARGAAARRLAQTSAPGRARAAAQRAAPLAQPRCRRKADTWYKLTLIKLKLNFKLFCLKFGLWCWNLAPFLPISKAKAKNGHFFHFWLENFVKNFQPVGDFFDIKSKSRGLFRFREKVQMIPQKIPNFSLKRKFSQKRSCEKRKNFSQKEKNQGEKRPKSA